MTRGQCARGPFLETPMAANTVVSLSPETVLAQMNTNGVTDVVWLPDSETNWLYLLMQSEPSLRLVGVSREGHAMSIAAGLYAGGRKPMILIQNTGMMESGDSIRGWLLSLNIPVVMMVGYRGWTRHGVTTDIAATYTGALPDGVRPQLLPDREQCRRRPHHDRLRRSRAHPPAGRRPGRRRISRLQSLTRRRPK